MNISSFFFGDLNHRYSTWTMQIIIQLKYTSSQWNRHTIWSCWYGTVVVGIPLWMVPSVNIIIRTWGTPRLNTRPERAQILQRPLSPLWFLLHYMTAISFLASGQLQLQFQQLQLFRFFYTDSFRKFNNKKTKKSWLLLCLTNSILNLTCRFADYRFGFSQSGCQFFSLGPKSISILPRRTEVDVMWILWLIAHRRYFMLPVT